MEPIFDPSALNFIFLLLIILLPWLNNTNEVLSVFVTPTKNADFNFNVPKATTTGWTMRVTFDKPVNTIYVWAGANVECFGGMVCTFISQVEVCLSYMIKVKLFVPQIKTNRSVAMFLYDFNYSQSNNKWNG